MRKLLYVEDDKKISQSVKTFLNSHGFEVDCVTQANDGMNQILHHDYELILLDLSLPDYSGEELCRWIKENTSLPVIMMTAKVSEEDVVNGFMAGADDYIRKPFGLRELLVRIESTLNKPVYTQKILSFQDLVIDLNQRKVFIEKEEIKLTRNEFQLLRLLAEHPNQIFTREQLIMGAFGYDYEGSERTIDSHIKNLRLKIEKDARNPMYIQTIHGVGYLFEGQREH